MGALRLIIGLPIAAAVTFGLFLLMTNLIALGQDVQIADDSETVNINITRQLQETDFSNQQREFERPNIEAPPPPPPVVQQQQLDVDDLGGVEIPEFSVSEVASGGFNPDRDAQPLVRIDPQYPDRCQSRAEGEEVVVVQFDVTPDGSVVNVEVIETTNSCFNRAAI
ncbi:MAG: hypothetical protein AAFR11_12790, partial [Pseudomonadota bacterium]